MLNGETNDTIPIALFGHSLADACNFNWFTTQRSTHPYQYLQGLLDALRHRYQEIDNDDHAYLRFRSLKQNSTQSVDDYYERMLQLASQFAGPPANNFLLSNFRAGLLKYLQVATVGLPRSTLAQARKSAKLAESGLRKEPDPTPQSTDWRKPSE